MSEEPPKPTQQPEQQLPINLTEQMSQLPIVSWKLEALHGNFMPAILMLEQNRINVNDVVDPNTGNTLLHLAGQFSFYNVMRVLLEKFNADINIKNKSGYSLLFYIVGNTERNIINFSYIIKNKSIEIDTSDVNGLNPLVHSIITKFHFPFLYFVKKGLLEKHKDKFNNPLTYFAIVNDNKFGFKYLVFNKKIDINLKYFNGTQSLGDTLIMNKYNSITKFIAKYLYNEVSLSSIESCRKNLLCFNNVNIYNYELLNTLYYYKTKNYLGFIKSIIKKHDPEKDKKNNINELGYLYKDINIRFMINKLIYPNLSGFIKILLFFFFYTFLYQISNEKNEKIKNNYFYDSISIIMFYTTFLFLFSANTKKFPEKKTDNQILESEIEKNIGDTPENLPDILEICPTCGNIKELSTIHCYRCGCCISNKIFHSNLFQTCITKKNIKLYLLYLLLKMNVFYVCIINALKKNPSNNGLINIFIPFWHKTYLKTFLLQSILGSMLIVNFGHFISLIFCLSVETPYKYIFSLHKYVYPKCLKKNKNNLVEQVPEINDEKRIKKLIKNLFA